MKAITNRCWWCCLLAIIGCPLFLRAGETGAGLTALDEAFTKLEHYDWGQSREPLNAIDEAIRASFGDATRREQLEAKLAAVLGSGAARAAKQIVCQKLSLIGSAHSVPALAALLSDPELSHTARLALERIRVPQATEALLSALPKVDSKLKVGLINSLGNLEEPKAVPLLIGLLASPEAEIASAAASALGHIASPEAARGLGAFRTAAPKPLEALVIDAWLMTAESLSRKGQSAEAATIFHHLYNAQSTEPVRLASFRGLLATDPASASDLLSRALAGDDDPVRSLAARILAEGPDKFALKPFLEAFQNYPLPGQVALLGAIRARREIAGRPVALEAMKRPEPAFNLAGLRALAVVGTADDIPVLARHAAGEPGEGSIIARSALANLPGKEVNDAMAAELATASPELSVELLHALGSRGAIETGPAIAQHLADSHKPVRLAALEALAALGGEQQFPAIIQILDASQDDGERVAAERALGSIANRVRGKAVGPIVAGIKKSKTESRVVLLRLLGVAGGGEALQTVRGAIQESDPAVKEAALRVLTEWSTVDAAPDLLRLAQTSDSPNWSLLAFRGYVRLCREDQTPGADKIRMLSEALNLAKTVAQKRLVIAALGELPQPEVLKTIDPFFADADLVEVSCLATVKVATGLGTKNPDEVVPALKKVTKLSTNPDLRDQARKLLESLGVRGE